MSAPGSSSRAETGGGAPVFPRVITQGDLDAFAELSGDHNPIHVDPEFAATTRFRRPVAHGMLLFSLVAAHLQRHWPGHRIEELSLIFPAPTPAGSRISCVLDDDGAPVNGPIASGARVGTNVRVVKEDGTDGLRGQFTLAEPAARPADTVRPEPAEPPHASEADEVPTPGAPPAPDRAHIERKRFTPEEVRGYERLSGEDARGTVPAGLIAGWFSKILGMDLPGEGTNYLKQRLSLEGDARIGEELTASVAIQRVVPEKRLVYLGVQCTGGAGRRIAHGTALVLAASGEHGTPQERR